MLAIALASDALATQWEEIVRSSTSPPPKEGGGDPAEHPPAPSEHVFLDTDSVRLDGGFATAQFLTVSDTPMTNSHNITMDRYVQTTAFDCAKKAYATVSTTAYLAGQEAGTSTENPAWKEMVRPLPKDALTQRIFKRVCGLAAARAPAKPEPQTGSAPKPSNVPR